MSLPSTSSSDIHSFSVSVSVTPSQIVASASNSRSIENPGSTSTTTIGPSPVANEGGANGSSTTSAMQVPSPSSAPSSISQAPASTHTTNTPIPNPSHSTNTTPSSTTARQEGAIDWSGTSLAPESSTSSLAVSTVSPPLPTITSGPSLGAHETHELVVDVGNCAEIGTPVLLDLAGDQLKLTPSGDGKFTMIMEDEHDGQPGYTASIFMLDDGSRCGQRGVCTRVYIEFTKGAGISMRILRSGDQGLTMYPLSMWLDDGVTWDAQLASTSESASHCWGWTEQECPHSSTSLDGSQWTIHSESSTARAFINFCPPNGPALSTVGRNPNPPTFAPGSLETWFLLPTTTTVPISTFISAAYAAATADVAEPAVPRPTRTVKLPPGCSYISTCVAGNSYILEDQGSTIVSGFSNPLETPESLSTYVKLDVITTLALPTFMGNPNSLALTSWIARSTDTVRSTVYSGWVFATLPPSSTRLGMTQPTLTTVTNSAGSAIVTTMQPSSTPASPTDPVNALPISPSPSHNYIVTSWTTWMEVNGSTVPAIAGQAAIETTIPVTYALGSGTIIPVGALSSLSVESMRTASPSPTSAAARGEPGTSNQGKIAAAIVGVLVALTLGSILVWSICYKRRGARSRDYLAQGSLGWGGSREAGLLDLDAGSREREVDREMVVEPWAPPVSVARRKELENLSASTDEGSNVGGRGNAGPGQESGPGPTGSGPTSSRSQPQSEQYLPVAGARSGKLVPPTPTGSRPQLQARSRRSQSPRTEQIHHHDVTLPHSSQSSLSASPEVTLPTPLPSLPRRTNEDEPDNAIPPLYNEEWRTTR